MNPRSIHLLFPLHTRGRGKEEELQWAIAGATTATSLSLVLRSRHMPLAAGPPGHETLNTDQSTMTRLLAMPNSELIATMTKAEQLAGELASSQAHEVARALRLGLINTKPPELVAQVMPQAAGAAGASSSAGWQPGRQILSPMPAGTQPVVLMGGSSVGGGALRPKAVIAVASAVVVLDSRPTAVAVVQPAQVQDNRPAGASS